MHSAQASLPSQSGGLGLQDPFSIRESARLAALISAEELFCELGADPSHCTRLLEAAKKSFLERGAAEQLLPVCTPDTKNLQQQLTAVLHARTSEILFFSLDDRGMSDYPVCKHLAL